MLEVAPGLTFDDHQLQVWRERVVSTCAELGWPSAAICARRHAGGAALAFAAPLDQLFTATEVNEWAWQLACDRPAGFHAPGHPDIHDEAAWLSGLRAMARAEAQPALMALIAAAESRGLPAYSDDDIFSIGEGEGSRCWPPESLPAPDAVEWSGLRGVAKALVSGSNGKTTTVRLLSALCRAHGWRTGHTCTDGLFVDGVSVLAGDYAGPTGARTMLRRPEVQAAVLETARGGLLRRGLAVRRANVAVVTNISADHYGEYGIHNLDDLADAKLVLAHAIGPSGVLVLNADDAMLVRKSERLSCPLAWFALDHEHPLLVSHRARGGRTCGVRDGIMLLSRGDDSQRLGRVADMPLSLSALAAYNIGNLAAAALAADALGIAATTIATLFARFGASNADNPGRLQRWLLPALQVFMDYAHNPDGLRGFLQLTQSARGAGRMALVLGQAGNRADDDIRALANVAAEFRPDLVILKDIGGFMRGRQPGEVPAILRDQLLRCGLPAAAIRDCQGEVDAARVALAWANAGDVLALPIHGLAARAEVSALLDRLHADHWRPGQPLPPASEATMPA